MDAELKLRIDSDKLAFYRAKYAVGCNQILSAEVLLQMGEYAKASRKLLKAVEALGESNELRERIKICEEKNIEVGTCIDNAIKVSDPIYQENMRLKLRVKDLERRLEIQDDIRQSSYGAACEAFRTGNYEDCSQFIKQLLHIDPKFTAGRVLKWELKLVKKNVISLRDAITSKDRFLRNLQILPPMELWKFQSEEFIEGPSRGNTDTTSDEVNEEHFYPSPCKRIKEC
ncbi:unnamed protein product [Allacma fusca]|uniref:Uncharacterized protein n=1 Tax=Allacma fusca TaxID=39272 RepID=A0A8J2PV70_9HEXA|nr:unnamed protein product [Allacma fusca]